MASISEISSVSAYGHGNARAEWNQRPGSESESGSSTQPRKPIVDVESELASWYVVGLPRSTLKHVATVLINNGANGEFLVRDVRSNPGSLGLTVKMHGKRLKNFLIDYHASGPTVAIRGTNQEFKTLGELIHHYSTGLRQELGIQLCVRDSSRDSLAVEDNDMDGDGILGSWNRSHFAQHSPPQHYSHTTNSPTSTSSSRQRSSSNKRSSEQSRWEMNRKLELGLHTNRASVSLPPSATNTPNNNGLRQHYRTESPAKIQELPTEDEASQPSSRQQSLREEEEEEETFGFGDENDEEENEDTAAHTKQVESAHPITPQRSPKGGGLAKKKAVWIEATRQKRIEQMASKMVKTWQQESKMKHAVTTTMVGSQQHYDSADKTETQGQVIDRTKAPVHLFSYIKDPQLAQEALHAHLEVLRLEEELAQMKLSAAQSAAQYLSTGVENKTTDGDEDEDTSQTITKEPIYAKVNLREKAERRSQRASQKQKDQPGTRQDTEQAQTPPKISPKRESSYKLKDTDPRDVR